MSNTKEFISSLSLNFSKFGGGSLKDAGSVKNVSNIIKINNRNPGKDVVVVSAMGSTTRKLISLTEAYLSGKDEEYHHIYGEIYKYHTDILNELFPKGPDSHRIYSVVEEIFQKIKLALSHSNHYSKALIMDQVMLFGEILSAKILSQYLKTQNKPNIFMSATKLIKTDDCFGKAEVKEAETAALIKHLLVQAFKESELVIIPGFIGQTHILGRDYPTTLGFEGSDYTLAVLVRDLKAAGAKISHVIFWKDVPGVMTCDPKGPNGKNAKLISKISRADFLEKQKRGQITQLLHVKTLQPLEEANVPCTIRSFLDPKAEGTRIS